MTVCIAAIYNNNAILAASDRMVTGGYGDITFEPPISKILRLTNAIGILTAGDQSIQIQVYQATKKVVDQKIANNPERWLTVLEVVQDYSTCFLELRKRLIEAQILSPYDLTFDKFISQQGNMNQGFVNTISSRIDRFQSENMNSIETIIAGIDDDGGIDVPHVYVVRNGKVNCHDKLGFASIGIGSNHAISHFMLSEYSRVDPEAKALLTVHQAKKKAEVSPGVGSTTDMCIIGIGKGQFVDIVPIKDLDIVRKLDKVYQKYTKQIKKVDRETEKAIEKYLKSITTSEPNVEQVASPSPSLSE